MLFRSEKNPQSFKIASIVCLPFCAILFCVGIGFVWIATFHHPPDFLLFPLLFAYYIVPSIIGVAYLLLAGGVLIWAWRQSPVTPKFHLVLLVAYTVVLLVYFSYIAWWYLTAQKYGYL
jgi:hypothetical protein